MSLNPRPPPLPARHSSEASSQASSSLLSPYNPPVAALHSADPRTSSTQSLVPSISESETTRRKLLVVYIHGFYGNDQSFRSFPAHVHACLKILLSNSHVIHSKVYPRYKTYKAIDVARDNFSAWLEPHESPNTDTILVGHSMGGLLAAEVVLLPNRSPYRQHPFKHKILGVVAMDAPFLGLHPGIVVSGIGSLFQPAPKLEDAQQQSPGTALGCERLSLVDSRSESILPEASSPGSPSRQPTDPYFNPPFYNDAPFREQPFVKRLVKFIAKHRQEGLINAVGNHINSHLEFGGCLADYRSLNIRYNRLRALEDVDEIKLMADGHPSGTHARVRFVNYYTLSPGRSKPPKPEVARNEGSDMNAFKSTGIAQGSKKSSEKSHKEEKRDSAPGAELKRHDAEISDNKSCVDEAVITPSLAIQSHDNVDQPGVAITTLSNEAEQDTALSDLTNTNSSQLPDKLPKKGQIPMQLLDPIPLTSDENDDYLQPSRLPTQDPSPDLDLAAIPEPLEQPILPDPHQFPTKDGKKQAEKDAKRLQRAYDQAIKERIKAIQDREKLLQKKGKKALKEAERKKQGEQKERQRREKEKKKRAAQEESDVDSARQASLPAGTSSIDGSNRDATTGNTNLKKFCWLPSKKKGVRDGTWVDVYMENMDEVSAHCGLFFYGPHYDRLVGDVGARIARWVDDDLGKRAVLNTM